VSVDASKWRTGVTWRAVLIGLILIPINSYWIVQMEAVYYSAHSTTFSLLFNAIFTLLILILLNIPLRKLYSNLALKEGELLTIYIMLCQASALAGHSMMQILPPNMAAPLGLATPENEWQELFWRYIPKWLAVSDERALEGYIKGFKKESTLYTVRHIKAWLTPVVVWSVFICVFMFVMICLNIIIRKQWTDRERLTYPIAQLPFEMTDRAFFSFRNKLMWISFMVVGGINLVNGLHFLFPTVPYLRVRPYDLGVFFTNKPWNAMGYMPLTFRPFLIGLIFLIPLDISFSCWFFFFFWKAQLILGSIMGWRQRPEFPEQSAGAYISLFFIALWIGRHHLVKAKLPLLFFMMELFLLRKEKVWGVFKSLFNFSKDENNSSTEPLRYRTVMLGLIFGFVFILFFCWKAGMSIWAATIFFVLYLMTAIGVTRIRAEVGSPVHDLHFAGPEILIVDAVGTRRIGPSSLSIIPFFWFLTRAHYSDVMPHQLEGFKLADRAKMNNRGVLKASLIATIVGTLVAFWIILASGYRNSGVVMSWAGWEPFTRLQMWLSHPTSPDIAGMGFFAYGLLFGIFLMVMRIRFLWWPLHPAGYAVSSTYGMRDYWSMFLLVWLIKRILLKYGGLKLHRQATPIFFGMILGEFAVGGFWALLGIILKTPMYNFTAWW
jgi:hypothetical protein